MQWEIVEELRNRSAKVQNVRGGRRGAEKGAHVLHRAVCFKRSINEIENIEYIQILFLACVCRESNICSAITTIGKADENKSRNKGVR